MRRASQAGFTLLELLVVVIIIGILATIALPQFGKAMKKARLTEAQDSVGAILTAEWAYFQENNEWADSANMQRLLVDVPTGTEVNFGYAINSVDNTAGGSCVVIATARANRPAVAGLAATGAITTTGQRTIQTSGI